MDSLMSALGLYRVETKGTGVNYNDYKAAVDRLRRVDSGEYSCDIYRRGPHESDCLIDRDKRIIYDAEHDSEPASVEWLREVLGEPVEECCDEIAYKQCTLWLDDDGSLQSIGFDCSTFCNPTRGDVLTALRLFAKKEGV